MCRKLILAIETSCDETSMAIIDNELNVLSLVTNTQIETFKEIGGVVPEISSRLHVDNINLVYVKTLKDGGYTIDDIDAIAVTSGPGLNGSLLVGINFAKTLSYIYNKPVIEVNHLIGHISAAMIEHKFIYPHLSLIVSGGHTELIYIDKKESFLKVGQTLDDAAGESFDKVARILNVGYPGGPVIDKLAKSGKDSYDMPYPKNDNSLNFSFSGLKSACFNISNQNKMKQIELNKNDFACSFQTRVVETLINKIKIADEKYKPKQISIVGGVSSNAFLRKRAGEEFVNLIIPSALYSTDNAAMVGVAAINMLENNNSYTNFNKINASPNLKIKELNE